MDDKLLTDMPRVQQDEWMAEHEWADGMYRNAHPIDDDIVHDICQSKMGPVLLHCDLSVIQAVALRDIHPYTCDDETWIERETTESERDGDDVHYYVAGSPSFHYLAYMANAHYDVRIEVENIADIATAHTRQYLRDVHGYEGDFGGERATGEPRWATLCNAQNDEYRLRDEEPADANYRQNDARGLVIQEGTHVE